MPSSHTFLLLGDAYMNIQEVRICSISRFQLEKEHSCYEEELPKVCVANAAPQKERVKGGKQSYPYLKVRLRECNTRGLSNTFCVPTSYLGMAAD